jgi:hypothetical protein
MSFGNNNEQWVHFLLLPACVRWMHNADIVYENSAVLFLHRRFVIFIFYAGAQKCLLSADVGSNQK